METCHRCRKGFHFLGRMRKVGSRFLRNHVVEVVTEGTETGTLWRQSRRVVISFGSRQRLFGRIQSFVSESCPWVRWGLIGLLRSVKVTVKTQSKGSG